MSCLVKKFNTITDIVHADVESLVTWGLPQISSYHQRNMNKREEIVLLVINRQS
jgi:hypothetical protein